MSGLGENIAVKTTARKTIMNSQIDEFIYQNCVLQEDMINISF